MTIIAFLFHSYSFSRALLLSGIALCLLYYRSMCALLVRWYCDIRAVLLMYYVVFHMNVFCTIALLFMYY